MTWEPTHTAGMGALWCCTSRTPLREQGFANWPGMNVGWELKRTFIPRECRYEIPWNGFSNCMAFYLTTGQLLRAPLLHSAPAPRQTSKHFRKPQCCLWKHMLKGARSDSPLCGPRISLGTAALTGAVWAGLRHGALHESVGPRSGT